MLELLAPAQNKECAITAINYGADAIYIGADAFGARKNATNSIDDIQKIVDYAHKFWVKVYCTINTILTDSELTEAQKLIDKLYKISVDAIIIQDMGILELAIEGKIPPIKLFASTQCDNSSLEKVKFFENIGIERVILARELSLKEIENICNETNIEIETFIHGALCVSYSGQCYLSYSLGGRSANRGVCAQPCRKKYSLIDEDGKIIAKNRHLLCLKDFNASAHLEKMAKIGVSSFKIEGRLKDETYVKNVVGYYRQKLDKISKKSSSGKVFFDFVPNIDKTFNRGFTDYFLEKRKEIFNFETPKSIGEKIGKVVFVGKNYFELDKGNLNPQDGIRFAENGCLINKIEGKKIFPNKMDGIKIGLDVSRNFDFEFEKMIKNSKTKRQIGTNLKIFKDKIVAIDEDENTVELKINSEEIAQNSQKNNENYKKQLLKCGESDFFVEKITICCSNLPFLPVSQINQLRRELFEKLIQERLRNYKKQFQKPLKYSKYPLKEVDYRANVHNQKAQKFYENCGCKVIEKSLESGVSCKNKELMRTKHCLKFAHKMCKSTKKLYLIDEKGKKYDLKFDCENCQMIIYAQV